MDRKYFLNLTDLLEFLSGQSALLTTQITIATRQGQRVAGKGYIFLTSRGVAHSLISSSEGEVIFIEREAYASLESIKEWSVSITSEDAVLEVWKERSGQAHKIAPSMTRQTRAANVGITPRMRPNAPAILENLPPQKRLLLRTVLAMVNGQRTWEQIKASLHIPPETVEQALIELHYIGAIE